MRYTSSILTAALVLAGAFARPLLRQLRSCGWRCARQPLESHRLRHCALRARRQPLGTGERRSFFGGFVQGDIYLTDRAVVLLRFDGVRQKLPACFEGEEEGEDEEAEEEEDEDEAIFRVNTLAFTPGLQFLVRPNVKLGFEYQVRQTRR